MAPTCPGAFNMARTFLDDPVERHADRPALLCDGQVLTYAELQRLSNRVGNALAGLGVGRGDRVLMVMPDSFAFAASIFGTLKIGAVVAMLNVILSSRDYAAYLDYSRPRVVLVHPMAKERVRRALARCEHSPRVVVGHLDGELGRLAARAGDALEAAATRRDEAAMWLFTSGTTGRAKAAVHTHADFPFTHERYARPILGYRPGDVMVSAPKLYFGYATGTNLFYPLAAGATAVMIPERSTPEVMVQAIEAHGATMFTAVPTMLNRMLALPDLARRDLSSLRLCTSAGEALPGPVHRRWLEVAGAEILDGIGSAEMAHIYISNRPGAARIGSLGQLVSGYRARLVGPDGAEVPPGQIGRCLVRGGSSALRYWDEPGASAAVFRADGWVVTADMMRRDEDGFYWYEGRADDLLKVGGIFVSPLEVEACLARHEAVHECAVVGRRHAGDLVVPVAHVVLRRGFDAGEPLRRELQRHVKQAIAPYKYPRAVEFLDALPRNERGKIERRRLA